MGAGSAGLGLGLGAHRALSDLGPFRFVLSAPNEGLLADCREVLVVCRELSPLLGLLHALPRFGRRLRLGLLPQGDRGRLLLAAPEAKRTG